MHAGVADGRDLDLLVAVLADRVEAEEGEEEVGLDALHAGAVGHDQAGVDAFERALGDDDRDLLDRRRLGGVACGCSSSSVIVCSLLDAALGLGDAADLGGELGRAPWGRARRAP